MGADYYNILKVNRYATNEELRKAYLRLAMLWHPDKNQIDKQIAEAKFKEISLAYDVLSDPQARAIYNVDGEEGLREMTPSSRTTSSYYACSSSQNMFHFNSRNAEDIFVEAFSKDFEAMNILRSRPVRFQTEGSSNHRSINVGATNTDQKPTPIEKKLECNLEELYNGCTKKIKMCRKVMMPNGKYVIQSETLVIEVKPGWKKGTKITFPRMGDQEPNKIPTDVVFDIDEKPHGVYKRVGNDLVVRLKITLADALGGTTIKLQTLDYREIIVELTNVVVPGFELIIAKEGMPMARDPGNKGDLRLIFDVIFPSTLTEEQRQGTRSVLEGLIW